MENIRINCIEEVKKLYNWMEYNTFTVKTNKDGEEYTLIKFTDKICGEIILWIYIYKNKEIKLEFRNANTANIEHEFKYKEYKNFLNDKENIKYLY